MSPPRPRWQRLTNHGPGLMGRLVDDVDDDPAGAARYGVALRSTPPGPGDAGAATPARSGSGGAQ